MKGIQQIERCPKVLIHSGQESPPESGEVPQPRRTEVVQLKAIFRF